MKNNSRKVRIKKFLQLENLQLNVFEKILLFAPIAIWFSYWPLANLGTDSTMNFKLSVTLIYVAILAICAIPNIVNSRKFLIKNKVVWFVGASILWQGLTLFWDVNVTRGILTFGVWFLLFLIFSAVVSRAEIIKKMLPSLAKILIISALIMSVFAIIQFVAGIWLARSETLLCAGCVAGQFGFVRPNVFAIEPQFFGSLLLAPLLILLQSMFAKKMNWRRNLAFIFLSIVLVLTLSRGAIFAFAAGAIVLFIVHFREIKTIIVSIVLIFASVVLALIMQGSAAVLNQNFHEKFFAAVASSVDQLSMGVIDFREKTPTSNVSNISQNDQSNSPAFNGYVAESTDVRVNLSKLALKTWASNPRYVLIGTGLGGAGVAMNRTFPNEIDAREIVQNEFVEILLETGLIGAVFFAMVLIGLIYQLRERKWLWAIVAAFILQWNFFSGLPSALHVYLIIALIFVAAVIPRRGRKRPAKTFSR